MEKDYEYLASSLSSLAGLPVRLYKDGSFCGLYHHTIFKPDLAILKEPEIFKSQEHVSYYVDENFLYYGLFRIKKDDVALLLGPVAQMAVDLRAAAQILRSMGEHVNRSRELVDYFSSIPSYPLRIFLQILCTVNYFINGERLSVGQILLPQNDPPVEPPRKQAPKQWQHNTVALEEQMLSWVEHGRVEEIEKMFHAPSGGRAGRMAGDTLRQEKNLIVCTATLVTRAAIRGGLDQETAFVLSDLYIQKAELMTDVTDLARLNAQMVLDFTKRVEAENCGVHRSKTVRRVRDYVLMHISDPITTEALSKECGMNRTYLCQLFAQETGMTVAQYVTHTKMEEAKRLMDITPKSIAEIAAYLGYSSQSHFQRVFKKQTGQTPGEYRRGHANKHKYPPPIHI